MGNINGHDAEYQKWLNSLDEAARTLYEIRFGPKLRELFEKLKLTDEMSLSEVVEKLREELSVIEEEARRLDIDPAQETLFPGESTKAREKEKELADRLALVNLVQSEITNKLHGVLSKNVPHTQIAELQAGILKQIQSRQHVLTYNQFDKQLKISDGEGFDVFIAGLDAIADVKANAGKKQLIKELRPTAAVLFDRMMIAAAEAGVSSLRGGFPLKTYMAERGLSDEKSLRRQVERDLEMIFGASMSWSGRGKNKDFRDLRILGDKGILNGVIFYEFTQSFFELLLSNSSTRLLYMQFPVALLRAANAQANPWAYFLGRRAALHRHMNRGQINENIIKIDTLLAACPDFPTLEEVMASTGNVTRRIIEPFERDMNAQIAAYEWEYQDGQRPATGKDFMAANVIIHWKETLELALPPKPAIKKITNKKEKEA